MTDLTKMEITVSALTNLKAQLRNHLDSLTKVMMKMKKLFGNQFQGCLQANSQRKQNLTLKKNSTKPSDLPRNRKAFWNKQNRKENKFTKDLMQTKMDTFHSKRLLMELNKAQDQLTNRKNQRIAA